MLAVGLSPCVPAVRQQSFEWSGRPTAGCRTESRGQPVRGAAQGRRTMHEITNTELSKRPNEQEPTGYISSMHGITVLPCNVYCLRKQPELWDALAKQV